ncbi:heme o synthase [Aureococcus anophagefferens]|uniref:Heme O synthase n=1 Tax=Aureococcus anophagefferens TaxID=44056 RepID=A0ABR1FV20_AURAN
MNALRALRPLATRVPAGLRAKSTLPASTTLKTAAPLTVLSDELARAAGVSSELSKARLSGFVAMTCSMGFAATGAPVLTADAALATYGVFATSACANTLNQIYEIPRDSRMARTAHRPLPSGRCSTPEALAFAGVTSVSGVAALATLSPTAAALAAANIGLYSGAYTMMKPRSEWNTWVGAAVGAVPPLIGWAAAGGSLPWLLAGILYLWQFPHFFALAWVHKADYAKGGYAMVPVRDKAGHRTASLIGRYAVYSTALPVLAYATGATSAMFALEGTALNAALLAAAAKFHGQRTTANARLVFRATLLYLPLILFFFVLHSTRLKDEGDAYSNGATLGDAVRPLRDLGRALCLHELLPRDETPSAVVPPLCPVGPKKKTAGADDAIK